MILLIIVLNVVFSALVIFGIVGLHLYAIAKSHAEDIGSSPSTRRAATPRVQRERYGHTPAPARS